MPSYSRKRRRRTGTSFWTMLQMSLYGPYTTTCLVPPLMVAARKSPPLRGTDTNGVQTTPSTNQQTGQALQAYFCPESPTDDVPEPRGAYPAPAFEFQPISDSQINEAIESLNLMKAPGPHGIGNVVFKQCKTLLTRYLGPIYRAMFNIEHYPQEWKESRTIVLRKPNKADYTTPKAYRPIALLDTMSKILSSCVAKHLSNESERLNFLEPHQSGTRPGRTTTDALHMLTGFVKDTLGKGDVTVGLFLDIKSAFPSVNHDVLVHDMRMRGIPIELTKWIREKLSDRKARLAFDDHVSDPLHLHTGIDQGAHCHPSLMLFIILIWSTVQTAVTHSDCPSTMTLCS